MREREREMEARVIDGKEKKVGFVFLRKNLMNPIFFSV
jgi:hypothetical protein